jgi:hypothetical protein
MVNLKLDHLEVQGIDGKVILKEYNRRSWSGLIWLSVRISGGLLRMQ